MYGDCSTKFKGDVGSRSRTSNKICQPVALEQGLQDCGATVAIMSYNGDSVGDFPTKFGFDPSHPVYSASGKKIASAWSDMFDRDAGQVLLRTLSEAFGQSSCSFWTGTHALGYQSENCANWKSNSSSKKGKYGVGDALKSGWVATKNSGCDARRSIMCLCIPADKMALPSHARGPAPANASPPLHDNFTIIAIGSVGGVLLAFVVAGVVFRTFLRKAERGSSAAEKQDALASTSLEVISGNLRTGDFHVHRP